MKKPQEKSEAVEQVTGVCENCFARDIELLIYNDPIRMNSRDVCFACHNRLSRTEAEFDSLLWAGFTRALRSNCYLNDVLGRPIDAIEETTQTVIGLELDAVRQDLMKYAVSEGHRQELELYWLRRQHEIKNAVCACYTPQAELTQNI